MVNNNNKSNCKDEYFGSTFIAYKIQTKYSVRVFNKKTPRIVSLMGRIQIITFNDSDNRLMVHDPNRMCE